MAGTLQHYGDTDTYIGFTGNDTIEIQTGGASRISVNDAGVLLGNANARVTTILDEDDMASNSATALATQQSIKAYVDAAGGGGTPGGSTTQVQYNNGGAFAGDADMTFDGTNLTLANNLYASKVGAQGDTNNLIDLSSADTQDFNIDSKSFMKFTEVGTSGDTIVFNEGSNNIDYRIESDDNANMFVMDAGANKIGIGTVSPSYELDVRGGAMVKNDASHQTLELRGDTNYGAHINYVRNNGSYAFKAGMITNASRWDITDYQGAGYEALSVDSSLNIGIQNTSPNYALDVNGDIRIEDAHYLRFGGDGASDSEWIIQQASNNLNFGEVGVADNVLYLKAGGNVGIGTAAPGEKLDVRGKILVDQYLRLQRNTSTNGLNLTDSGGNAVPLHAKGGFFGDGYALTPDASEVILYKSTTGSTSATAGKVRFASRNDAATSMDFAHIEGKAYDDTASGEDGNIQFVAKSGGSDVGMMEMGYDGNSFGMNLYTGTASGSGLNQINTPNNTNFYLAFGSNLSYSEGGGTIEPPMIIRSGNPDPNNGGGDAQLFIQSQDDLILMSGHYSKNASGNDMVFRTGGTARATSTERMRILGSDGNVGIGTSSPSHKLDIVAGAGAEGLHVAGAANQYVAGFVADSTTSQAWGPLIKAGTNSSDAALVIQNQAGSSGYLYVRGDGNVGIGTTSPVSPLDVKSASTDSTPFRVTRSANANLLAQVYEDSSGDGTFALYDDAQNGDIILRTGGDTVFANNGNFGIATTAPQQKLHVEGGFRFRDGNSSSQRLEGFGWNDNFALVVSGSDALGLAGGTPGVRFLDQSANVHLTIQETGTNSALLSGADSAGLYFATQSGTRLELTGNNIIKTGQTIDNAQVYSNGAVNTATSARQVYVVEAVADPGQAGTTFTTTLNLPDGNEGGERFTVTCIAVGNFKPGGGGVILTGSVVLGGTFINGTNFVSPTVTSFTAATAANTSVMQVKTYNFTWVAAQHGVSTVGGWVYTVNTM